MKKLLLSLFALILICLSGYTQVFLNWQRFTDGTAHVDDSAVAVDVEETATNVYVGGNVNNTATLSDIVIKSYDLNGNLLWSGGYASPLNDHLVGFICDGAINAIYGTGNSDNGSYLIGLLIKMDMKGNLVWSKNFTGIGNVRFKDLKVAPNGNILVVGEGMLSSASQEEGIIACYDVNGNLLWSHTGKKQAVESEFNHLEIDGTGNIYTSGFAYNGTNKDGYIAKYDENGKLLDSITINGAGNKDDEVKCICLNKNNGLLYAATVVRVSGSYDETTITAYNPLGLDDGLWEKPVHTYVASALLCDSLNVNVILIGRPNGTSGTSDYLALSYNATTGAQNWARTISGGKRYNNIPTASTLDVSGNLLVTGGTNLAGAAVDIFTVAYDHLGTLLWTKVFNGSVNGDDYPTAIGADVNGDIFVAGTSAQPTSLTPFSKQGKNNRDFTLLKYSYKFICNIPTGLFSDGITTTSAKLHWDAMPEAPKYKVQYRLIGGSWVTVNANINSKTLTGLAAKTKYEWQVKTICSNNPPSSSDYSVIQTFITGSGFSENLIAHKIVDTNNSIALQIFSNPASQKITLLLKDISGPSAEVNLYDLAGKELKHYQFAVSSKTFNRQIDISSLSPGSYLVVISGDKQKWTQILIKQ